MALYTGWVSLAVVAGTAATGVRLGLPGDGALAEIAAVLILVVAAGIVASVVTYATAVVGYAAAVVWALAGIALNGPPRPWGSRRPSLSSSCCSPRRAGSARPATPAAPPGAEAGR